MKKNKTNQNADIFYNNVHATQGQSASRGRAIQSRIYEERFMREHNCYPETRIE